MHKGLSKFLLPPPINPQVIRGRIENFLSLPPKEQNHSWVLIERELGKDISPPRAVAPEGYLAACSMDLTLSHSVSDFQGLCSSSHA